MTGYRTLIIGFLLAVAPSAFSFLTGIDWSHYFSANVALVISGAIMIVMRLVTTTAVATKPPAA